VITAVNLTYHDSGRRGLLQYRFATDKLSSGESVTK